MVRCSLELVGFSATLTDGYANAVTPINRLREHEVVRIFIAAHNTPPAFAEEGQFLCEALQAGVKYLVRISTTASAVRPDNPAYYPRSHWALETLLEQPEYQSLQWTSLQPALFTTMLLRPVAGFVKHYRKTGTMPGPLPILLRADKPHAVVHAPDVGAFAAHLLAAEETSPHNQTKYVVNGPEDLTGARVRQMAEDAIREKISDVKFEADRSFIDRRADTEQVHSKRLIRGTRDVLDSSRPEMILSTATSEIVHQLLGSLTPSKEVLDALLRE